MKADTIANSKKDENRRQGKYALQQEPRRLAQRGRRSDTLEAYQGDQHEPVISLKALSKDAPDVGPQADGDVGERQKSTGSHLQGGAVIFI